MKAEEASRKPGPSALSKPQADGSATISMKAIQDIQPTVTDTGGKIYNKSVRGLYANWRIAMVWFTQIIFYGLPWLTWNDRQAFMFDLGARKFYIFGLVLWPQDVIYLTFLLILSAFGLFLFTAVAGRLFCGYACPQTVYTEIFMWIEKHVEGDRMARIRLDEGPWNGRKLRLKSTKYVLWALVAFITGFTFIGYFAPIRELGHDLVNLSLGPWQWFWLGLYSLMTWGFGGVLRDQVCKHMCPYARFQSVMVDQDTYIVTYDPVRGDPRGKRSRKTDHKAAGLGDCVDCSLCVQACPTGIDIRNGLQYMCIGCGACIDACDEVMDKMNYDRGLIRYSSERAITERLSPQEVRRHTFRPRILVYTTLIVVFIAVFIGSLATRNPLRIDVIRDRGALGREAPGGWIENVYRLQMINAAEEPLTLTIQATGLPNLEVLIGQQRTSHITLEPAANRLEPVIVRMPASEAQAGLHEIKFVAEGKSSGGNEIGLQEKSSFVVPQ